MFNYPKVIILDGVSSSGKTTIGQYLANDFQPNYLFVYFDFYTDMLPVGFFKRKDIMELLDGPYQDNPLFVMQKIRHRFVKVVLDQGYNVIMDHIMTNKQLFDDFNEVLAKYNPLIVKIECELKEAELREKHRGDRKVGLAAKQFKNIHKFWNYNLSVDTTRTPSEDCAKEIIKFVKKNY